MKPTPGDVVRLAYRWPHEARSADGRKDRACVVFQGTDGAIFASPMTTVPPDAKTAPYAIPITSRLQTQLGLRDDKPSWVYANHANLVELPNPALKLVQMKGRSDWTHGRVPCGLVETMREKREEAIAKGDTKLHRIKRDTSHENYRSARYEAADSQPRYTPGAPGNAEARQEAIKAKAMDRARRPTLGIAQRKAGGGGREL